MKIKVEQRHIDLGKREDSNCCAVALAVQEACGTNDVEVDGAFIGVGTRLWRTPANASEFIEAFDTGQAVEPIEINLLDDWI